MRAAIGIAIVLGLTLRSAHALDEGTPPFPELPVPQAATPETGVDALPEGDPRRPQLLLDLALTRHHEAEALEGQERRAHAAAMLSWRDSERRGGRPASPPPPLATPRADARRAEAVRLAERALEERLDAAGVPKALLVSGVDAARIGRTRDAARALGTLVRRFPGTPYAAEAWLALGEHHWAGRDLTRARAAFEVAARSAVGAARAWSTARLAEVALVAGDGAGALDALARALGAGSSRGLAVLDSVAAAPEDLALERGALARLADLCERSGDPTRALVVRQRAASEEPGGGPEPTSRKRPERPPHAAVGGPRSPEPGPELRASAPPPSAGRRTELRLAVFGGDGHAAHALGLASLAAGRAAEARALFERALAAGVAGELLGAAENDLAASLSALGDLTGARAALARAVEQDPRLAVARENLSALSSPPPEVASPQP